MSGAQQGYNTDSQQHGTFQAPHFMQEPNIPSPGGMYHPSAPAFPGVADGIPLSGNYDYYPGGKLEHSIHEGCFHRRDPTRLLSCGPGYGWFPVLFDFYPSVPAFPWVADGIPLSGNYDYYPGGRFEHSIHEGCCRHRDPNNLLFCGLGFGWFLFLFGFFFIVVSLVFILTTTKNALD